MDVHAAVAIVDKAVPFFFALIGLEIVAGRIMRRPVYRLNDSVADLALGAVSELAGIATKLLTVVVFAWINEHLSVQTLAGVAAIPLRSPLGPSGIDWVALGWWSLCFVLIDHQYYWAHRFLHEVNVAWGAHVAHHSSEEYNLAVALRQSATQTLFTSWFFFPLAVVGFTWVHFAICFGINLIYQFWIHTRLIGRLGPLEWIMNTPSHHRVHHGRDPKYIDKNHAGVFIVWDRLYGTFRVEDEEPTYGVTTQLRSHNAIWSNVHHYAWVWSTFGQARGARDKLRVLFGKTGWRPDYLGGPIVPGAVPPDHAVYDPEVSRGVAIYATIQFLVATGLMFVVTARAAGAAGVERWLIGAGVVLALLSFSNVTTMFDGRPWLARAEVVRLLAFIALGIVLVVAGGAAAPWGWLLGAFGAVSLGAFVALLAPRRHDRAATLARDPAAAG